MPNPSLYRGSPAVGFSRQKRIGSYLTEAGLLTSDQIQVILNDQQATGMRFGDIAVARGWLKEQTIEWIMAKVIEPERKAIQTVLSQQAKQTPKAAAEPKKLAEASPNGAKPFVRRDAPISKPLPPINSSDTEVNWVG
jgi:hypothetical protein